MPKTEVIKFGGTAKKPTRASGNSNEITLYLLNFTSLDLFFFCIFCFYSTHCFLCLQRYKVVICDHLYVILFSFWVGSCYVKINIRGKYIKQPSASTTSIPTVLSFNTACSPLHWLMSECCSLTLGH